MGKKKEGPKRIGTTKPPKKLSGILYRYKQGTSLLPVWLLLGEAKRVEQITSSYLGQYNRSKKVSHMSRD